MCAAVSAISYIAESYVSSKFHVCGCECYKLYSGKLCIVGEEKRLGGETVGLQYPVWLLGNAE